MSERFSINKEGRLTIEKLRNKSNFHRTTFDCTKMKDATSLTLLAVVTFDSTTVHACARCLWQYWPSCNFRSFNDFNDLHSSLFFTHKMYRYHIVLSLF
jgi:hypothetical protein